MPKYEVRTKNKKEFKTKMGIASNLDEADNMMKKLKDMGYKNPQIEFQSMNNKYIVYALVLKDIEVVVCEFSTRDKASDHIYSLSGDKENDKYWITEQEDKCVVM